MRAHRRLPSLLNASDWGNSPPEEIGRPMGSRNVGFVESIEKSEIVLDPAYDESKLR